MTQQQPSNHIPEAKKMVPGDELHLTLLMAPFSLNFFTGQDRQHLLAFGRAAFEAGQAAAQQAVQADVPLPMVELFGVKDGQETSLGTVPMPPTMRARELLKDIGFRGLDDDDGDGAYAMAACEQLIEYCKAYYEAPAHPAEGVPAQAEPFMWAIQEPGGSAYMDKNCVSTSRGIVQAEVDGLNLGLDADDEPYKVVPVYLAATQPADGVPAQAFKTKVYQALGIGSACDEHVAFANIENLIRREHCLSAIEREFFMVETPPDEGEGDTGPGEECLLNWGSTPEQYVKQFAEAIAATHPTQQGLDATRTTPVVLGAKLFSFSSMQDWINGAQRRWKQARVSADRTICLDQKGRVLQKGLEFMRAEKEGVFPVDVYLALVDDTLRYESAQAKQGGAEHG